MALATQNRNFPDRAAVATGPAAHPAAQLQAQCEALREAILAEDWAYAERVAAELLPLTQADRSASPDHPERLPALLAAQQALREAQNYIQPSYRSLQKLLHAWGALPESSGP